MNTFCSIQRNDEFHDEFKKMIQATTEYLIAPDKKELMVLLTEVKEDACLIDEFLEGKPIFPMIDEIMKTLEASPIAKTKQHRLKMLVDDITSNRYRLQSIFTRLDDAQDKDDTLHILKELVKEELLSEEQYEELAELEGLDLPAVVLVIKDSMIG